jgi:hypothetical protein
VVAILILRPVGHELVGLLGFLECSRASPSKIEGKALCHFRPLKLASKIGSWQVRTRAAGDAGTRGAELPERSQPAQPSHAQPRSPAATPPRLAAQERIAEIEMKYMRARRGAYAAWAWHPGYVEIAYPEG